MASTLQNLESKEVLKKEKRNLKQNSNSKFKKYRKTQEDKVSSALNQDSLNFSSNEPLDPYSKERTTKTPSKARVMSLTNSSYQNTLLEKLLQSQTNPESLSSELKFRETTVELLTELKDIMKGKFGDSSSGYEYNDDNEQEYKRSVSSLSKNIASLNMSGLMKDFTTVAKNNVDKLGLMEMASSLKDVVKETMGSGAIGDMIKNQIQDSILGLLGDKNKTMIKSFKEDPVNAIQDFINAGALGSNKAARTLFSHFYSGIKIDPIVKNKSKDMSSASIFDNKTHTTINTVLPDILSKILANQEKGEQRKYNYDLSKWETMGQIIDSQKSKDTVTKYTEDLLSYFKDNVYEDATNRPDSRIGKSLLKKKNGQYEKDANDSVILDNENSFRQVVKNIAKSELSIKDLTSSDNLTNLISKFSLDRNTSKSEAAIALQTIISSTRNSNTSEQIANESNDYEERKGDLRYISDDPRLGDLTKAEMNLYTKLMNGTIDKKEFKTKLANLRTTQENTRIHSSRVPYTERKGGRATSEGRSLKGKTFLETSEQIDKNNGQFNSNKYLFGTTQMQKNEYNQALNGDKLDKNSVKMERLTELKNKNIISLKEFESAVNSKSKIGNKKVEIATKKLVGSRTMFGKLLEAGVTAEQISNVTKESIATVRERGYFSSADDLMQFMNDSGELDTDKLQQYNSRYSESYIKDIDTKIKKNKINDLEFDIMHPGESMGNILNDVFTDPALVRKLGIGSGSAAGYALGKLINNRSFIKSPKLGYLLGAVGGGIMNMEWTQRHLMQTFGPSKGESGFSNREIFTAKLLNRWLPAVGMGGKTAKVVTRVMSHLGPAGRLLGPVAGLGLGAVVGGFTPFLLDKAKDSMFNSDDDDKSWLKKVGDSLRKIPVIDEFFTGVDKRSDFEIYRDTVSKEKQDTDKQIQILSGKKFKTDAEKEELKSLTKYSETLKSISKKNSKINGMSDSARKDVEFNELYSNDSETAIEDLQTAYKNNLTKRDNKNSLGDASKASFKWKQTDENSREYAVKQFKKYKNMDVNTLTPDEKRKYDLYKRFGSDDEDVTAALTEEVSEYLNSHDDILRAISSSNIEDDSIASIIGPSGTTTKTDKDGNVILGLDSVSTKKEFDEWLARQPEDAKENISEYMNNKKLMNELRRNLNDMARLQVDANFPTLGDIDKERATANLINQTLNSKDNLLKKLKIGAKQKTTGLQNKILNFLGEGGTSEDDINENNRVLDKLERFIGGGKGLEGSRVNSLVKMKDLKRFKFSNGSSLSASGCSIASFNNAMNYLGLGGVSTEHLISIANQYLSDDGGVTSGFFKTMANELNLIAKTYTSFDNRFTNELLAKFKSTPNKAVVLLLRNPYGGGSHFVNLTSINTKQALINDPEKTGMTDVSTSTLVATLLEIITLEKTSSASNALQSDSNVGTSNKISGIANNVLNLNGRTGNMILSDAFSPSSRSPLSTNSYSSLASHASKSGKKDDIVNVRILEDYTLPFKMNDGDAAREMFRTLKGDAKSSYLTTKITSNEVASKKKNISKEFKEAQQTQDNINSIADMVEGMSTGKGGAGGYVPPSESKSGGVLGFAKNIISGLILGGGFFLAKAISNFKNILTDKDSVDDDGNIHAGDASGSFKKAKAYLRLGTKPLELAKYLTKKTFKITGGILGKGKQALSSVGKAGVKIGKNKAIKNTSKFMSKSLGEVMAERAAKKSLSSLATSESSSVLSIVGKLSNLFKGNFSNFMKLVSDKLPKGIAASFNKVISSGFGKKIMTKITSKISGILTAAKPFIVKASKKAAARVPIASIVVLAAQAVWSFYDGFTHTSAYLNRKVGLAEVTTRFSVGIMKLLWDTLPEIIAVALAQFPGAGTAASWVFTGLYLYLQYKFGGFEHFMEVMGLRKTRDAYIDNDGNEITKEAADELIRKGIDVTKKKVKIEPKKGETYKSVGETAAAGINKIINPKVPDINSIKDSGTDKPKMYRNPLKPSETYDANKVLNDNVANLAMTNNGKAKDVVKQDSSKPQSKTPRSISRTVLNSMVPGAFHPHGYADPLNGTDYRVITSAFGPRPSKNRPSYIHHGIDFRGKRGDPIYSVKDGMVLHNRVITGGGNEIVIKHIDGLTSHYMHMNERSQLSEGSMVKAGDMIGHVGSSGGNYLPHLHLGMQQNGKWIDPMIQLGLNPGQFKIANSPENMSWQKRNAEYVNNYSDEIRQLAELHADRKRNNAPTEKGGETESYPSNPSTVNKKPEVNTNAYSTSGKATYSDPAVLNLGAKVVQMEKQLAQSNAMLTESLNKMASLLSKIVDNTEKDSNNSMKEIMGLSM